MVLNLNQVTFRGFGTTLPQRDQGSRFTDQEGLHTCISLTKMTMPVYQATADTWLRCATGTAVLSASADGENFQDFYLDKPVCVKPGTIFSLSAFMDEATVDMITTVPPQSRGSRSREKGLHVGPNLRVENLYTFFYQEKEQGFIFPGESHSMLELTYVDQGSLHSVADGNDLLLEQGDMVLYGPGQWHMQYADMGVAPRYVTISFDISGCSLDSLINRKFKSPPKAVTLLKQMLQEQEQMDGYSSDMILYLLTIVLLTLLRETDKPNVKLKTAHSLHNENEIIRRTQQYISAHIREKLSVPAVARSVDVSPSYLTALFHKNLQISPGEYIRRIKLQESKQMIRENNMNFTEIAAALQYSTVHHFSRQFKEKFGITPTEYAKSVR